MNISLKTILIIILKTLSRFCRLWLKWVRIPINFTSTFFDPETNTQKADFQKRIVKCSGSVTGGYSEHMIRGQLDQKLIPKNKNSTFLIGIFAKASIINFTGRVGVSKNRTSLSAKVSGDVLTASSQAGLSAMGATFKVKAAMGSGSIRFAFEIFETQIEFGITGDILSIGAEATAGIFDDAFEVKANASCGIGGGFIVRIKPSHQIDQHETPRWET